MRKLVLSLFLALSPAAAFAGQSASPVQAFSYGTQVGTESNPIYAAISTATPSTAGPRQAASPVELFSYGIRVGTKANPLYVNMDSLTGTYAPLASPALTGTPTTPTGTAGDTSTQIANDAFVANAVSAYIPLAGTTGLTGNIAGGPLGGTSAHIKIGQRVMEGMTAAPDADLGRGWAIGWNGLGTSQGNYGETDFYNLDAGITGGFAFCSGTTVALCRQTPLFAMTPTAVTSQVSLVAAKGSAVTGGLTTDTETVSGLAGTGNAFVCVNASGALYRSSTACN